ncbi:hypothetical protein [Brunnivagina elsteri]|uniref:DUF4760 domain-containing protein n=1 Tax=Brunnivagina elsteri CCALA 953 TaxID=987040 RepID=A0A2A2TKA8_9CYAN|nr:hypothetical protein [Calothrix elsteri]PAX56117.1 hypothetical protein CK510_10620 [Calothrix elsteri CCALA 953]
MDTLNLIVQIATIISVLVAAATIWVSGQMNRRQLNVQVFMAYTDRYEKIINDFPEDALSLRFNAVEELPPVSDHLRLFALKLLNLSSEEYFLWKAKYLDDTVWKVWEREIKRMLHTPLMMREWTALRVEYDSQPDFIKFVDSVQRQSRRSVGAA